MLSKVLNRLGLYTRRQMIHQKIECSISYKYCEESDTKEEVMAAIQNTPLIGSKYPKGYPGEQDKTPTTWDEFKKGIPPLEPKKPIYRLDQLTAWNLFIK